MGARSHHPMQGQKRPLHADIDVSTWDVLVDVAWMFSGPGALLSGAHDPEGVAAPALGLLPAPAPPRGARRRAATPRSPSPVHALAPAPPRAPLTAPSPSSGPPRAPVPAPPRLRIRRDGVRVVARPLAMLPGVDYGPALRLDLHPVDEGIVFVSRDLELSVLGDDAKGPILTGLVPVTQLSRFWSTVTQDLPSGCPVIVRLRSAVDAELLGLLRIVAPPSLRVVSYRLDESPVGSQRSSYLLPDVDAAAVAATGAVRAPLEELRAAAQDEADEERRSRLHLARRRVARFLRRHLPEALHDLSFSDPASTREVFVDGSVLRGTRTGGAAGVVRSGPWAAVALSGATLPLEAELDALTLGHVLAVWCAEPEEPVIIHSDSRAALALLREAQRDPLTLGDARGERIRRALRRLLAASALARTSEIRVGTTWVKGHSGTPGNELADEVARSAARNSAAGVSGAQMQERLAALVQAWENTPRGP